MRVMYKIDTPFGTLIARGDHDMLDALTWGTCHSLQDLPRAIALLQEELMAFFNKTRSVFTVPMRSFGTPFQRAVFAEIAKIPLGKTRSYKDIAKDLGMSKASRAVGAACKANPFILLIPCHRVIHQDGSIGGYMGKRACSFKERLLAFERS